MKLLDRQGGSFKKGKMRARGEQKTLRQLEAKRPMQLRAQEEDELI